MTDNVPHDDNHVFIAKYQAALKLKMSMNQLAHHLEIKPDSVRRRRLTITKMTGLSLPMLLPQSDFSPVEHYTTTIKDSFEDVYTALLDKHYGTKVIDNTADDKKIYIITSAQNATEVHAGFLATMLKYAEIRDAELMVIAYRYKNPTSIFNDKDSDWWWQSLTPHLIQERVKICDGLQVVGEIKITPTATTPLSGLDTITGSDSAIFGHPKLQMKTIPTPNKSLPKILSTTGSCTLENYTDSKAGHKGKFHHNISAAIIEVDGEDFHIRHVHGEDDGSFYDLEYYYTQTGRTKYGRASGFVPGDIHAEFVDPDVEKAIFTNEDSIVNTLRPENMVYHDLEDFYTRNHHHRGNDVISYGKHHFGRNNVEAGMQVSADFVDRHSIDDMLNVIVASNHNDAADRWLMEAEPKLDPENARFYYYMKFHQLSNVKLTETGFSTFTAFEFWCGNPLDQKGLVRKDVTKFLKRDESFTVSDIEIGFHGDKGLNGARGTLNAYTKIGPKSIIGHSHSPGIHEGVYQVGLSARLDLEYASGPSSWLHSHCLIYPNGSRTLINVLNGKWRGKFDD